MKTITIGFFLMVCFNFILVIAVHADEAVIHEDNLNIRSGPGTEFDLIGQATINDVYTVIDRQDDWTKIKLDEGTGWIITEYITINRDQQDSSEKNITIQHSDTQLRNGPSTGYDIIHFADAGDNYEVIGEEGDWYEITSKDVSGFVLKNIVDENKETSYSTGFENRTIVIDAGHGGRDVGAIGTSGIYEKNIAYVTAQELAHELRILGAEVLLTRPEDEFISLGSRASFANAMDTDVFLSLHYNSVPESPSVTGVETYYYHEQNKELATYVQEEIIKETEADNRGTTNEDLFVIRQGLKPSLLLELGFISNAKEESLLETSVYQKKLVTGIINGLGKYFANK
ncbi:N-acetylmuramoyl-L-alanine amidase [Virgibacillus sp. NKC19-3]|uniref:N-acetylmuramoyl-L-alanine amidase n=1 Tax=Virgibacillus saliphilus TaxID=2831674 RepID=UPI001C9B00E3|nr:N-acetylmuramoyl-L-alanine amidase [Virgibacillus sp. NKC19-3]MBY7143286.1 N-acetylmuramoyl-L-alanine amidase [Virgibacillus sp. NKC19-3]